MASSPRLLPDRAGSSCPPGAIAKLHRDSQTYNESAVRFGPGEMEPPYRPGGVGHEDQFAAAIPSCALRQESLSLTARARPVPAGSRLKTRSGRNDQWRLMNDERGSHVRSTRHFVSSLGLRASSFLEHSSSVLGHSAAFVY